MFQMNDYFPAFSCPICMNTYFTKAMKDVCYNLHKLEKKEPSPLLSGRDILVIDKHNNNKEVF